MRILELASVSLCLASAASALAAFLVASFAARFWASTDRVEVAAARASRIYNQYIGILEFGMKQSARCRKRHVCSFSYLQTIVSHTYLDISVPTIPDISLPYHHIHNTTSFHVNNLIFMCLQHRAPSIRVLNETYLRW